MFLSKTKSVTRHYFYISNITNSSSFNGKIFREKSMLENFRANILKIFIKITCKIYDKNVYQVNKGFKTYLKHIYQKKINKLQKTDLTMCFRTN